MIKEVSDTRLLFAAILGIYPYSQPIDAINDYKENKTAIDKIEYLKRYAENRIFLNGTLTNQDLNKVMNALDVAIVEGDKRLAKEGA